MLYQSYVRKSPNTRRLDCLSRKIVHSVLLLIEEHGDAGEMSSKIQEATALAFLWSGHAQMIMREERISCIDIVMAFSGTSSIESNQPSLTCWRLERFSRSTTISPRQN